MKRKRNNNIMGGNALKGYAAHEQNTLTQVIEARSKATQVTLPKDATPEQMQAFAEAQKQVGSSLARLMAVSERYPDLKANQNYQDLMKQMTNVENQINAVRNQYIGNVKQYNLIVRQFPTNITANIFGYTPKEQLKFDDLETIKEAPKVKF